MGRITRYAGIGGHQSNRATTVEWLTPPSVIETLGPFDLDPCAPIEQPHVTAAKTFTILDDGLAQSWYGRVWLNPPYANGVIEHWLAKLAQHGRGTALIFARTETDAFFRHVWNGATALLFMRGRVNFLVGEAFSVIESKRTFQVGEEAIGNAGAPTVLCAYGDEDADILADCGIEGAFVPLMLSRSVAVSAAGDVTWRELVVAVMRETDGPVHIEAVWRVIRLHPKASGRAHARAKVRQIMQSIGRRVERGQYQMVV